MAEPARARALLWQLWALLGALATVISGARLVLRGTPAAALSEGPSAAAPRAPEGPSATVPAVAAPEPADRLLQRLSSAESASERCDILAHLQASEDAQVTYAISAVLERAQLSSVRLCATEALGRQPTPAAQSWLIDLAEDPEPEVQRSALTTLGARADSVARAVVLEATHSGDLEQRINAVTALLKAHHPQSVSAFVALLPSIEDRETLGSLIDALGATHDALALPVLDALIDSAERDCHLRAIAALGELGEPAAVARLSALLELGSVAEFQAAAGALAQLAPESALSQLRGPLASADPERQRLALSAIAALDLPDRLPILGDQLRSGDGQRVRLALRGLVRKPEPALEGQLTELASRSDAPMRGLALRALSQLTSPSAQATVQRLQGSEPDAVERPSERPGGTVSHESPSEELRRLSLAGDSASRQLALRLLADQPEAADADTLERLASDPDMQIQSGALLALQARAPETAARLAQRAFRAASAEDRQTLLSAFSDSKSSALLPLFELALSLGDDDAALQAVHWFGALEGPDAARHLLGVLSDGNRSQEVRVEAATGLRQLGGPLARSNRALLDSLSAPDDPGSYTCSTN